MNLEPRSFHYELGLLLLRDLRRWRREGDLDLDRERSRRGRLD
jgi:hypothetical protein